MFRTFLTIAFALLAGAASANETHLLQSVAGIYELELAPDEADLALGELHYWDLLLRDAEGNAIEGAAVTVDGGMPAHGHGLPTAPKVVDAGVLRKDVVRYRVARAGHVLLR